jgi:hypothetical protein
MIQWYREGQFPIDRLVQYFDVRPLRPSFGPSFEVFD